MPNDDLTRAFAALSGDAGHARLAPAAAVRKRGDRQMLTRSLAGVAAAAVLVAGALVGSRLVLTDHALPPLPPAESSTPATPSPVATPSPSATPSKPGAPPSPAGEGTPPETETSAPPSIPKSIPARAFLTSSDGQVEGLTRLGEARTGPRLCSAASYPSADEIGVSGSVRMRYHRPGAEVRSTPSGYVVDTVRVYRGDGAASFLDEFRAAVRKCPRGERGDSTFTYSSLGSLGVGDESLLVRGTTPARGDDGELSEDGSKYAVFLSAVRVGDSVSLVETEGYEAVTAQREDAEGFGRKAAQRLADWRD